MEFRNVFVRIKLACCKARIMPCAWSAPCGHLDAQGPAILTSGGVTATLMLRSAPPMRIASVGLDLRASASFAANSSWTAWGAFRIGAWALIVKTRILRNLRVAHSTRGPNVL
eukprot:6466524-Amphidinium_carterae.3